MNSASYKVALGGIVTSLCVFLMFMSGILPAFSLTMPMIAGMLIIIVSTEISIKWSFLTYLSVSLLSLLITPDKGAALVFIIFFGHYPIIKQLAEKIRLKAIVIPIKILVFNICFIAYIATAIFILGDIALADELAKHDKIIISVFIFANLFFLIYDIAVTNCTAIYLHRIKPKMHKN